VPFISLLRAIPATMMTIWGALNDDRYHERCVTLESRAQGGKSVSTAPRARSIL
jgi:hypothetical protein